LCIVAFPTNGSAKDIYWHEDMTTQCPSGTTASLSQPPQACLLVKPFARNHPFPDYFRLAVLLVNETRHYRGFALDVSIQVCREICLFMKPVYANPAGASRSASRGLKCKAVFRSCCGLKGRCRRSSASDSLSGGIDFILQNCEQNTWLINRLSVSLCSLSPPCDVSNAMGRSLLPAIP